MLRSLVLLLHRSTSHQTPSCLSSASTTTTPRRWLSSSTFPTTSSNPAILAIQKAVFGYVPGNGARNGRRFLQKALFPPHLSDYYPPRVVEAKRIKDRSLAKDPAVYARHVLAGHQMQGAPDKELNGPFLPGTYEDYRANLRVRAYRLSLPGVLQQTDLPLLDSERRRLVRLARLKIRGKSAPKKGAEKKSGKKKK